MTFDVNVLLDSFSQFAAGFIARLPYTLAGLGLMVLFLIAAPMVQSLVQRLLQQAHRRANVALVFGRLARWATVIAGILIGLMVMLPGFSPAELLASLGIASVAIGFAFKDILQNFLAGLLLLLTAPLEEGDEIVVQSYEGTVEKIYTRATYLRTYDGRLVLIPNTTLFTNPITINTASDRRRQDFDVGIGYGDDMTAAKQHILDAIRSVPEVLEEPAPEVLATELADSAVVLRARWWVAPYRRNVVQVQDKVVTAIKNRLDEAGVDIPFPTQVTLFQDQTPRQDDEQGEAQGDQAEAGQNGAPAPRRSSRS
ncbi:mechanosensitive ion channel family protein [Litorilinea aerophila]|uniref:Mechanosensitive ion channel family protein n=1 Tax=Litorilinea aerophila TaxID=1204385 RepID=A0A540V8U3_9CHLR|nr:mechanosensitive ion channel family protein [Litorilinea aerophila]MCC9078932.1 mechanosensitive ion channel family protein [Litorilinea aerophila]